MTRLMKTLVLVIALVPSTNFANPLSTRTWISGVGDDANAGSRTAPCKTFSAALGMTAAGGEIDATDPVGLSMITTVTKAVTFDGQGSLVSTQASAGNAFAIVVGATDTVTIRNISISGPGSGQTGILFAMGGTLILENVTISGFQNGVSVTPSADSRLIMRNCSISNCSVAGITATGSTGNAYLDLENVRTAGCGTGLNGTNGVRATLKGCSLSMNTNGLVIKSSGISSRALLDNCIITNTTNGVTVGPGTSLCRMSDCTISNNLVGVVSNSGATLSSAGNNTITGNGTDGPTPPVYALK